MGCCESRELSKQTPEQYLAEHPDLSDSPLSRASLRAEGADADSSPTGNDVRSSLVRAAHLAEGGRYDAAERVLSDAVANVEARDGGQTMRVAQLLLAMADLIDTRVSADPNIPHHWCGRAAAFARRSVAIQRNIIMELAGGGEETASGQGPSVSAIVGCPDGGKMLTKALYILGRSLSNFGLDGGDTQCSSMQAFQEAEAALTECVALREAGQDENLPEAIVAMGYLHYCRADDCYLSPGETVGMHYDLAIRHYRLALDKFMKTIGEDSISVARVMSNLGLVYEMRGKYYDSSVYPECESWYRRALAIRERVLRPGHPDTQRARRDLAAVLETTGRADEAAKMLKDAQR